MTSLTDKRNLFLFESLHKRIFITIWWEWPTGQLARVIYHEYILLIIVDVVLCAVGVVVSGGGVCGGRFKRQSLCYVSKCFLISMYSYSIIVGFDIDCTLAIYTYDNSLNRMTKWVDLVTILTFQQPTKLTLRTWFIKAY